MQIERLSIELTNRCQKGCWFCYNHSHPAGDEVGTAEELCGFILDCREHGTKAVSLGGGEPLESPLLRKLDGAVFRSLTTNGLLLQGERLDELLFELLSPEERTSAEIAMVEHVLPRSATPESAAAAGAAIDAVRKWLAG